MRVFPSNSVNFDILRVIDVNKIFVDVGAIGPRLIQGRIEVARLIADLKRH